MKLVLDVIWLRVKWMFYLQAFLFITFAALPLGFFAWEASKLNDQPPDSFYYDLVWLPLVVMSIFLCWEVSQMRNGFLEYLWSFWNWVNMFTCLFVMVPARSALFSCELFSCELFRIVHFTTLSVGTSLLALGVHRAKTGGCNNHEHKPYAFIKIYAKTLDGSFSAVSTPIWTINGS